MYHCNDCNADFVEPCVWTYSENLDGERGIETINVAVCPQCGGMDIEEEVCTPD